MNSSSDPLSENDGPLLPVSADRTELFVSLLGRSEAHVHAHILTLLPNWSDADDVHQRTNLILWRKFGEWNPEQDFTAWACGVARWEVRNFLRVRSRDRHCFNDALLAAMEESLVESTEQHLDLSGKQEAMQQCLQKLRPTDLKIIQGCYSAKHTAAKDVAVQLGRPTNTIYKALIRIRRALFECIERTLAAEERS